MELKSACFWDKATYEFDPQENQRFIKQLKQDTDSNPREQADCSHWKQN